MRAGRGRRRRHRLRCLGRGSRDRRNRLAARTPRRIGRTGRGGTRGPTFGDSSEPTGDGLIRRPRSDSLPVGRARDASARARLGSAPARVARRVHVRSACGPRRRGPGDVRRGRGRGGRRLLARGRSRRHRPCTCRRIPSRQRRRAAACPRLASSLDGRIRDRMDGAGRRRCRRRGCRLRRHGGLGQGRRAAVRRCRRVGADGQEPQRVDISLRVRSRSNAEVDERVAPGRADLRSLADVCTAGHRDRPEVQQRRRVAERRLDRDRLAAARNCADERDGPGGRRSHRDPSGRGDLDPPVLTGRVRVVLVEREAAYDRPVDRPGPGARRAGHRESAKQDEHDSEHCYLLRCQN
jgi:hypothetical protein